MPKIQTYKVTANGETFILVRINNQLDDASYIEFDGFIHGKNQARVIGEAESTDDHINVDFLVSGDPGTKFWFGELNADGKAEFTVTTALTHGINEALVTYPDGSEEQLEILVEDF